MDERQQSLFQATPLLHKASFMPPKEQESLKKAATAQELRVLAYLQSNSPAGASTIWRETQQGEPLTSTRRCLTNLAEDGRVVKMGETVKGMFGKSEHLWRVVK